MSLIPPNLSETVFALLVASSFLTSMMTAALGIGGGVTLLAVMAQVMPPVALLPIHGVVQMGSNLGRAALLVRHVDKTILAAFSVGAIFGAAIGGQVVVALPVSTLEFVVGLFVLYSVWGPKPPAIASGRVGLAAQGAFSTLLTMFVGATGPFVAATLKPLRLDPQRHVGTFSAAMVVQHLLKVIVFGLLGFAFADYAGLLAAMLASGFAGTYAGQSVLVRMNPRHFHRALDVLLTLLAAKLIWGAVAG